MVLVTITLQCASTWRPALLKEKAYSLPNARILGGLDDLLARYSRDPAMSLVVVGCCIRHKMEPSG